MNPIYKKYRLHLIIVFMVCLACFGCTANTGVVYASYPDMDMTATPNPVGSGARALGIGGAFISVADDATAASWNPGALLRLKRDEFSIVGSFYSGKNGYDTAGVYGDIDDYSPDIYHLNYFSIAHPFMFCQRNIVFSISYQHLYEFSLENSETWREKEGMSLTDIFHKDFEYQRGSLHTISPAIAVQVVPAFSLGVTFNYWDKDILDNGWENLNVQDAEGTDLGTEKIRHSEIYERYIFSGFNMHVGFLFTLKHLTLRGTKRRLRIAGVVKTPFKADIRHEKREILYELYPGNPKPSIHKKSITHKDLRLKMPISYGLGISLDFSDTLFVALDICRTHWDDYLLVYPSGDEVSPINKKTKAQADIEQTIQVRIGAEYLMTGTGSVIPIRMGIFYDPEPAPGKVDDFYGVSIGTGILYKDFSFDLAYQFRFGTKRDSGFICEKGISSDITQHYFYTSLIFYF